MKLIKIVETDADSKKKYKAIFCECKGKTVCKPDQRKVIQFGSKESQTFTEGASQQKKDAYIARHSVREDFTKIGPASLSYYILWSSKSLKQGIANFKAKFNKC